MCRALFIVKAEAVGYHRAGLMAVLMTFTPSAGRMRGQCRTRLRFTVSVTFHFHIVVVSSAQYRRGDVTGAKFIHHLPARRKYGDLARL